MDLTQCPSLASLLTHGQQITHRQHQRGWIETPDGRFFQPKAADVQFIKTAVYRLCRARVISAAGFPA